MAEETLTYQSPPPTREVEQLRVTVAEQLNDLFERKPYLSPEHQPLLCIPSKFQKTKALTK